MSEFTADAPRPASPEAPGRALPPAAWWCAAAASTAAVAVALTLWARTRPGFDPYGWLTWGQTTLHGGLDTNAAPSWKPLPYVFTLVYALAGSAQLRLWMFTATALSLAGVWFAARLACRLTEAPPERRWAGWLAGAIAGAALLGLHDESPYNYLHYVLSSQSDPVIVAGVLAAIDCHLRGRPRAAFVCGVAAGLGRPEVWPLLGAYALWLWRARRDARWLVVAGTAALLVLWFGIPALSSRSWFVAGDNANGSGRAPSGNRVGAELHRFLLQEPWPLEAAALLSVGLAALRRDRTLLLLAAGVVVWMAIDVAFALHGWPGLGRYMFEASAVTLVIGAAFAGRMLAGHGLPGRPVPRWAGVALAAALIAGLVPFAVRQERLEHRDIVAQRVRTQRIDGLVALVDRVGASRIRGCGEALTTTLEYQTLLADTVRENVNRIGFKFPQPGHPTNPIVVFSPVPGATTWTLRPLRQTRAECRALQNDR